MEAAVRLVAFTCYFTTMAFHPSYSCVRIEGMNVSPVIGLKYKLRHLIGLCIPKTGESQAQWSFTGMSGTLSIKIRYDFMLTHHVARGVRFSLGFNPFTTGNPFLGTKLLGFSIGRVRGL